MFTIIDFETTGLNPAEEQVIEIGAIKLDNHFNEVGRLEALVQLEEGRTLSDFIKNLTGITEEHLKYAVQGEEAGLHMLRNFIGGDMVVAQFASFDLAYLAKVFVPNYFYCTRSVSQILDPGMKSGLAQQIERYNIKLDNHHRAMADVEATAELFKRQVARLATSGLTLSDVVNVMTETKERPLKYVPENAVVQEVAQ